MVASVSEEGGVTEVFQDEIDCIRDVSVLHDRLYVLSRRTGLQAYDVSEVASPKRVEGCPNAKGTRLERYGNSLFVAGDGPVVEIHIEDPAKPRIVCTYAPGGGGGIVATDKCVYAVCGDALYFGKRPQAKERLSESEEALELEKRTRKVDESLKKLIEICGDVGRSGEITIEQAHSIEDCIEALTFDIGLAKAKIERELAKSKEVFPSPKADSTDAAEKSHYMIQSYLTILLEDAGCEWSRVGKGKR